MGGCGYSKESQDDHKSYLADKYTRAKTSIKEKVAEAKITYASQIEYSNQKINTAKYKVKGYSVPQIIDESEAGHITKFEYTLPLAFMDIDEFEKRIKKLGGPD